MGTENKKMEGLVSYTADGEKVGKIQDLAEVTVSAGKEIASSMCQEMIEFHGTLTARLATNWRCRGRKRFIKLLMSKGISRNEAESVAKVARIAGVPYGELWRCYFFWGIEGL